MASQFQHLYSQHYSEVYRKLNSLLNDIKSSYIHDCEENEKTKSIKEIIEIINGILIMSSLEEYFSHNKEDINYFMKDFTENVIKYILYQNFIYGENGQELALDLFFHFIKLFFKFHKNKEYVPLFDNIRKIFDEDSRYFKPFSNNEKDPKKMYTCEQFNEEFCKDFKIEKSIKENFKKGDKVDFLYEKKNYHPDIHNKAWIRGEITDIANEKYIIRFPKKSSYEEIKYPIDSQIIRKEGTTTKDWDWRLNLKKNDVVDCYDRGKWYPATVCDVIEFNNEYGHYKEYKIGFRLYLDKFLENKEYDYNLFVNYTIFWDNNNNMTDKDGNSYYGDDERCDEKIPFYSKRIQKFQKFSSVQREVLSDQFNSMYNHFNGQANLSIMAQTNNNNGKADDRIKLMTEILSAEYEDLNNEDNIYLYEKDGKKNYILGKKANKFYYYYARLLKLIEKNECYDEIINIIKDNPNIIELYNIFFILEKSMPYLHKEYFKENRDLFKKTLFDIIENMSSKELKIVHKEYVDYCINFISKVNYLFIEEKNSLKNDIRFELAFKFIKSSVFDKKIQGLKMITEVIKSNSEQEDKQFIIDSIKKNNLIKDLFGTNYHTQIISKSNEIIEFILKNGELTEEEIKLIWSLTEQGDLEVKMVIIKLISDFMIYLNEKFCNIILESIDIQKVVSFNENEIELVKNLAFKAKNKKFLSKCCEIFCNKILEINNLKTLEKSHFIDIVVNFFEKDIIYSKQIIDICESNLKDNKNVLIIFYLLKKIIEKNKNKICVNDNDNNNIINDENNFINQAIFKLINEEKLLSLFKNNFLDYKKRAKEYIINNNIADSKNLIIDGYNHDDNMKYRILFLIKIIPILYPKFDFFGLLKEICLEEPALYTDNLLFYEYMEKCISEENKDSKDNSSEDKIGIKTQLFNMLANGNKTMISTSQFNLYIDLFLEINTYKKFLTFYKHNNDEYIIDINKDVNINDIFGIDKLWDLLFELNQEFLSQKLIHLIYNIYEQKNEIQNLLDKCINLIKDIDNITYNKLEKCINILKYIILDSEKKGYIQIKSHLNLLKDCLININLELKKEKQVSFNLNSFYQTKKKGALCGNTTLLEIKQILSEKYNLELKDIEVKLKKNDSLRSLDSTYNNKTLKEIYNLDREKKRGINSEKLKFIGNFVEKENLIHYGHVNSKFEYMLKEWFNSFSNGTEIMDKDTILNFIKLMKPDIPADENNPLYIKLMQYDKENKSFLLENEFIEFYTDLARKDEDTVWDHIKKVGYGNDLEKIYKVNDQSNNLEILDKNKLPRYILGNDESFHDVLIKLFNKFDNKMEVFQFLFFLSTNEKKYFDILDNYNKLIFVENETDINYLEEMYILHIIESLIQDLEVNKINLNQIFKEKKKPQMNIFGNMQMNNANKEIKLERKLYLPFDDEDNLEKKRKFLIDYIENNGYEKLIQNIENTLESIKKNFTDEEKIKIDYCKRGIKIINIIYDSLIKKENKKEIKSNDDVYFLFENIDISQILSKGDNGDKDSENKIINELREKIINIQYLNLIEKLIIFLLNFHENDNDLCKHCVDMFLKLITTNEKLFDAIKANESIKKNLFDLIKNNINNQEKFFIQSLMKYIKNSSSSKQEKNINDTPFLIYLFEISNSLFKELINDYNNKKINENNSHSILFFFEYFSGLIKEILKNDNNKIINEILNEEFVSQIYALLYNDIKEKNISIKLPEDIFIGMMTILITIIKNDKTIKEKILSKKINEETLFDIIYKKILPENKDKEKDNDEIQIQNFENDLNINNLLEQLNKDENIDYNFVNIENLTDIIKIFNTKQEVNEEIISDKVTTNFKNFIIACLEENSNVEFIKKLLKILSTISSNKNNRQSIIQQSKNYSHKEPKKCGYVGLKNIGCICYMNSILQQMYMVPPFRNAIISSNDKKSLNKSLSTISHRFFDDNLLHQLQRMYTFLRFSEKQAYNPKDFCSSFKDLNGQTINILLQQDSQEFFNSLCDKIENLLKLTKYKYIISNIFTGKTCSSVICEECATVSNKFEDFYNLTLEVKNINNLYDSLKKFIEPEKIEEFNCDTCKKKVTIIKRTSLAKLPNVLFVHLKRFYMDYEKEGTEKINSKFEFPNKINLKNFCIEEINKTNNKNMDSDEIYPKEEDYYEYELKGINIHLGSAEGGHYISFIDVERDGVDNKPNIISSIENDKIKSRWLKFNDSLVTEFNTNDIPIESYGGFVDNDINNENVQNAYLLIYERKKKTPIKIVIEKEKEEKYLTNEKYQIVSYNKEKKNYINKFYDISYSNKESRVKEEDLYNIIFKDEDLDESYYYLPYYNIEKIVKKENFEEVMNKNRKFLNRSMNKPIDLNEKKDKWNDILFSVIKSKEFNILDEAFSGAEIKQFIEYFKSDIFNNQIFNDSFSLDEEQKNFINSRANILLNKIILPLVNMPNKTNAIYKLLDSICEILTKNESLKRIFDCRGYLITGVFNLENVKIVCDVLYSIMLLIDNIPNNLIYFKNLFSILSEIILKTSNSNYSFGMDSNDEDKIDKSEESSGYYYLDLIHKVIKINNEYVSNISGLNPIAMLTSKITKKNITIIQNLLYDIMTDLLNLFYAKKIRRKNNSEKNQIIMKIASDAHIIYTLFKERNELLEILLENTEAYINNWSEKLNEVLLTQLFQLAITSNKLIPLLNLLYKLININDEYIINRLYSLMGYPDLIIKSKEKKQEKKEDVKERYKENDEEEEEEKEEKEKDKEYIDVINSTFGNRLLKESKNGEIYKYRGPYNEYESYCILGQLFPCTDISFYSNPEHVKKNQKLTKKERNKLIYDLLKMSLLNEGNYALFKYIYLTQSRFIKYENLYEEMIDILSQEKDESFDLIEIKKNAEKCINRINYEVEKIWKHLEIISEKSKYINDDSDDDSREDEKEQKDEKKPELPEAMEKNYKEHDCICEFTGFSQKHFPDELIKVEYVLEANRNNSSLIFAKYYTTYKDMKEIRDNYLSKDDLKEEKIENKIIEDNDELKEEKEKEKKEEKDEDNNDDNDDSEKYITSKVLDINKIENDEDKIIKELIKTQRKSFSKNKITIIDSKNPKKNEKSKISILKLILYTDFKSLKEWNATFEEYSDLNLYKFNYFYPSSTKGEMRQKEELLSVYRRNMLLDFINIDKFRINVNSSSKDNRDIMNESNGMERYF